MPVMTISLVCESRVTWKVGSSLAIFCETAGDLLFVAARLGLDGQAEHRRGKRRRRQLRCAGVIADRVADVQIIDLGDGEDVAGDRLGDVAVLAALHEQQPAARADLPVRALTSG